MSDLRNRPQRLGLRATAAFALCAALSAPSQAEERWVPLGPSGGLVRNLAQAPSDRQRLYAISQDAATGLFRSRDGGLTWQSIRDGLGGAGIVTVAVAPRDPDFVLLSAGSGAIWRSRDGGSTWTQAAKPPRSPDGSSITTYSLLFVPGSERRVYAATDRGVFRSLDGGATWDLWSLEDFAVTGIVRDPANPQSWFVSAYEIVDGSGAERGIFRSDDGGATWSHAPSVGLSSPYAPERLFFHAGTLYAQWDGALFRTADRAATWSPIPRPPTYFAYDYALGPSGSIYAATEMGVFVSSDGVHWNSPNAPLPGQGIPNDVLFRLVLLPHAPGRSLETVVASGRRGIWRSTDGGARWAPSSRGISERIVGDLVVLPDSRGTVLATFEDGLFRIDRAGDTWRRLPSQPGFEAPVMAADPHHPGRVYAFGGDFGVSDDRGNSWTTLSRLPHSGITVFKVDPGQPDVIWAGITLGSGSSENGFAFRSVDGGRTWIEFQSFEYLNDLTFDPAHPKVVFRLRYDAIDRSTDGGETWTLRSDPHDQISGAEPTALLFDPRSRSLWLGTDRSGVYRSGDAGRTFHRVSAGLPLLAGGTNPAISNLVLDAKGDLYISLWYAGVYRLRPGHGWTAVNVGLPLDRSFGPLVADPARPGLIYDPTYGAGVFRLQDR